MLLDRRQAERAVVTAPGEHDANRMLRLVLGQRGEEHVDRCALAICGSSSAKLQVPSADRQDRARRQHIDMLRFNFFAIPRVENRHPGRPAENLGKHAFAVRRQMSDDHKRQPITGRDGFEELLQRLDTARRGTNADDGKAWAS